MAGSLPKEETPWIGPSWLNRNQGIGLNMSNLEPVGPANRRSNSVDHLELASLIASPANGIDRESHDAILGDFIAKGIIFTVGAIAIFVGLPLFITFFM